MKSFCSRLLYIVLAVSGTAQAIDSERLMARAERYFERLPEQMPGSENDTRERVALGKKLFFDKRLSINDSQACVSCHRLEDGFAGVDNLAVSPGAKGKAGTRNSPTVLNAGMQDSLFWDGRAENLVEQARGPILNEIEMAMPNEKAVEEKLGKIESYRTAFATAFPASKNPVSFQHTIEAIAAFERSLLSESRFDDFLDGDSTALTEQEKRGLATFIKLDCVYCHDGVLLGGMALEHLGAENPYENQSDLGLYALTGKEEDKMYFKVAPLRNVALTAPYFHDGKIKTLEEAVKMMAKLQLDEDLEQEQIDDISSFLHALTDKEREKNKR